MDKTITLPPVQYDNNTELEPGWACFSYTLHPVRRDPVCLGLYLPMLDNFTVCTGMRGSLLSRIHVGLQFEQKSGS